uniref:Uncharacterized protein n=1 Tax=Corethron hystrix TaxID=216773 RepID=A0A7S1BRI6_9STRA|mmetsp:Transcript_35785/g.83288  ORF Transcript_35785/g.83288 Transcript_35785/m.83288 type:complete len:319 (+) Transcript_35785:164-1120(+)|eukprot:CAMPEP_0113300118 /NCGR_PEP_ID=MMETSP0010_2-20120614/1877_1 /TAXON_ID=216773 ORGANISM="Corethron hystrix, Strain 308" /NCGR_SAMPLE_ID=MMETSP0010_2 /ASSEMBLY_ACC=CAM_ASM_000155 /LENGTH=318 /DNA_ID=CAMNT_0000153481 /DNA_START=90 /DNA_END=1046 /DNA_ORIENTATION=+ /assembly_acc=CAM_ASM_000155
MKDIYRLPVLSILFAAKSTKGFGFDSYPKVHPSLKESASAQEHLQISVKFDIGIDKESQERGPHLYLNGLELKFCNDDIALSPPEGNQNYPKLPGINGPRPNLSTGGKHLEVISSPSFIDHQGIQNVDFKNGCWEMLWREDAPAGTVVCGFDIPNKATRNGATLPAGTLYVSFVLWNKDDLMIEQARKKIVETEARKCLKDKDDILQKYNKESNIIKKALLYRSATMEVEKYHRLQRSGILSVQNIPDAADVVPIRNNLMLTSKGTVWMKNKLDSGPQQLSSVIPWFSKKQELLGVASIQRHATKKDVIENPAFSIFQ